MAAGAGHAAGHSPGNLLQGVPLFRRQRLLRFKEAQIFLNLLPSGHAGKRNAHRRNGLKKAESPARRAFFGRSACSTAASSSDNWQRRPPRSGSITHRDVVAFQQSDFFPGRPGIPSQGNSAVPDRIPWLRRRLPKTAQYMDAPMDGKTQVTDAACLFLLRQVVENAILRIKILFNVHFAYVVEKIKSKYSTPHRRSCSSKISCTFPMLDRS